MKRFVCAAVLGWLALPAVASAQERGQVGATMGFPPSLGLMWHVSDRLAIRPEIGFSRSTTELESSLFIDPDTESSAQSVSTGVSAIWYVRAAENNVRPYLSPRLTYIKNTSENPDGDGPETTGWSMSGSFGVQYTPVRAFAVFGELGLNRSSSESAFSAGVITGTTKGTSWGTRSVVGVIFYFK